MFLIQRRRTAAANNPFNHNRRIFTCPLMIFRVPPDKMDALDLLAPLDPEDSLELWDSLDPRESL